MQIGRGRGGGGAKERGTNSDCSRERVVRRGGGEV